MRLGGCSYDAPISGADASSFCNVLRACRIKTKAAASSKQLMFFFFKSVCVIQSFRTHGKHYFKQSRGKSAAPNISVHRLLDDMFGWAAATRKRAVDPSSLHNSFPQGAFMVLQHEVYDTLKKKDRDEHDGSRAGYRQY